MDISDSHITDLSLSRFDTGIATKGGRVKLVLRIHAFILVK
jgi:hypothetical protein